ncbi:hypothetical protein ACSG7X_002779 [Vibrio fluvialis]|nr:hypothetical protein [Vibrio fluvialis]
MDTREFESTGFGMSVYKVGEQFYETAEKIGNAPYPYAYIVNMSFAIELFIKSLNVTHKASFKEDNPWAESYEMIVHTKDRRHSLLNLFNNLPEKIQDSLKRQYIIRYNIELIDDLVQIKDAFLDYRYIYEKDGHFINLGALSRVALFFKTFIESVFLGIKN